MGKADKSKVIDPSGKVTVIRREERYPRSTELLMRNGFPIILLNMVFGLLPTTLFGSRLKYYRCSVAQAYAFVFGVCMIFLSFIFLPLSITTGFLDNPRKGATETAVLILSKVTHVLGFLLILIRGYFVSRKMPVVWGQMAKLMHISVVDLHGKRYHGLKKLTRFTQYAVLTYVLAMIINELNIFMQELDKMMPQFYIYYNLQIVEVTRFNYLCISFGYIMWKLCSYSHILVSILAGFIIVAVTVCLRAGNDHLLGIFEDDQNLLLIKQRKKITVLKEFEEHANRDENVLKALNQVKDIHVVAENVLGSVSKIYGVSLIIEVLILIANLLVDVFYILVPIITNAPSDSDDDGSNVHSSMRSVISQRNNSTRFISQNFFKNYINENGDMPDEFPIEDQPNLNLSLEPFLDGYFITLLGEAFIHSYFFYKLCCRTTEMVNEAKEPLQILKTVPYTQFSQKVQHQISILKRDLATNTITLTAANYFQINKFTLTSVTSALTTYIVVLLQFSQQEQGKDSTGNSTRTYT